jgi:UDPglucose 6-dehydrogenase
MAKNFLPELEYFDDPYEACQNADAIVIMTEWNEYRSLDLEKIKKIMKNSVFVDLRNIYDPKLLKEKGFEYYCIGRK